MPSASPELQAKFPGMDSEALSVLDSNYTVSRDGMIRPKHTGYKPSPRENDAIDYLFQEWDYGYEPVAERGGRR